MQTLSAKCARFGFGRLIDRVRAMPVAVAKLVRPVVVVLDVEKYLRPKAIEGSAVPISARGAQSDE